MKTKERSLIRRLSHRVAAAATAIVLATAASHASATTIVPPKPLDPTLPGQFGAGDGANATFLRINGTWDQSAVYWKEPPSEDIPGQYSNRQEDLSFKRVGEYQWGTGIWGLSDWTTINVTGGAPVVGSWKGKVATIAQADTEYANCYSKEPRYCMKWGSFDPLPVPTDFFGKESEQNNWTSRYTGYIRITEPGEYNFGVLYDDGFFLNIWGSGETPERISSDFLSPRDRLGFEYNLLMSPGLYRFELGSYDRLEVGVVNLAWKRPGSGDWTTVPTEDLVTAVPTPGTASLLVAGLGALLMARVRRKRE